MLIIFVLPIFKKYIVDDKSESQDIHITTFNTSNIICLKISK